MAERWDELRGSYFSDRAISISGAKKGGVAVDLGAGTGFMSEGLLREGLKVIAVDESPEMLATARRKLSSRGDIEFRLGSAEKIPIEDGAADHVFANMLLHHATDPRLVVCEISRILKHGGNVVLTDLDEHDSVFLITEHHDRWMGFDRGLDENCCATSSSGRSARVSIFAAVGKKPSHKTIK